MSVFVVAVPVAIRLLPEASMEESPVPAPASEPVEEAPEVALTSDESCAAELPTIGVEASDINMAEEELASCALL